MSRINTYKYISVLVLAVALCVTGCGRRAEWRQASGMAWGTTYHITYLSDKDLADSIIATMRAVELTVSPFDADSEISRVNRGETDTLSAELALIFSESQRIAKASGGYFDPTVAPLVNLWGFGYRAPKDSTVAPDSADIAAVMERVGISDCRLGSDNVMRRKHRHTEFDFSAIAKGYGVDCLARMLRRNGSQRFMVEVGGEISVAGKSPTDADWHIQVDSPLSSATGHKRLGVVEITNCAMATSGNYRNFRELADGSTVSHTISPLTGQPAQSQLLSVTIVASECMTADALATACMAMPYPDARAMILSQPGVAAIFVTCPDTLQVHTLGNITLLP